MPEYFVVANSNAAPFWSDTTKEFVEAASPEEALNAFVQTYSHPAGLFAAQVYRDANAYEKRDDPLVRWLSERAHKQQAGT